MQTGTFAFAAAQRLGDPFLGGHQLPLLGKAQLAGQFGDAFADSIGACPLQRWCGPLVSSYGLHLVWIAESVPSRVAEISDAEVQKRLVADVLRERGERMLERALVGLRKKYGVRS